MALTILGIIETRKAGQTVERLRRRIPPVPATMLAFVEEAMRVGFAHDPDETVIRLLRPTPE